MKLILKRQKLVQIYIGTAISLILRVMYLEDFKKSLVIFTVYEVKLSSIDYPDLNSRLCRILPFKKKCLTEVKRIYIFLDPLYTILCDQKLLIKICQY